MAKFTVNRKISARVGPFDFAFEPGTVQFCPDDLFQELRAAIESTPGALVTFLKWDRPYRVEFLIDGYEAVITTGSQGFIEMPFDGRFLGWRIYSTLSGSLAIDLWKSTFDTFPPVVGGSICGASGPTLTSGTKASSDTLTDWDTSFSKGDILRVNVDSVTTIQQATLSLLITRITT